MKEILVTCALILKVGKVLCTQRSEYMRLPGKWEFPGGKVEQGESPEACLRREIAEELDIAIKILGSLSPIQHSYDGKVRIRLLPYLCEWQSGVLNLQEHQRYCWRGEKDLKELDWAEADQPIVEELLEKWNPIFQKYIKL
ncbi:(deoxy)nucleoside triphosphate pyrophosphohydrolase [Algoriphagus halophytocola]|uniref:(deoxy)nucleoside triphosphate pyrophosphohydrolase n=1 Tax=Algoriphagus halophytocola TaxID=2991499 RepID=UPI0022DE6B3C|nr:(deoxy)nucleoside triphosphate pyrophosphohydrolase [Algoriphagus sp. TR-M9]WBL43583.1 (deoxy)nucleoside triphosphate pyrophosphohydrolase [Algoriphagus sp. TR-M9]